MVEYSVAVSFCQQWKTVNGRTFTWGRQFQSHRRRCAGETLLCVKRCSFAGNSGHPWTLKNCKSHKYAHTITKILGHLPAVSKGPTFYLWFLLNFFRVTRQLDFTPFLRCQYLSLLNTQGPSEIGCAKRIKLISGCHEHSQWIEIVIGETRRHIAEVIVGEIRKHITEVIVGEISWPIVEVIVKETRRDMYYRSCYQRNLFFEEIPKPRS